MIKPKMLTIFSTVIGVLAFSATPAFAEFESASGKGTGTSKSGPFVLEGGGETLECTSTEGTWTILSGGKESLKGNALSLNTKTWNGCKAKSKEIKEVVPAISPSTIQLTQAAGATEATATV